MDFGKVASFAEDHPVGTGVTVFVGGVLILYMLGYIGGSSTATSNDSNAAAAYYNAAAAQTVAGTQLQIAQAGSVAQTAQARIAADAAVKINAAQVAGAAAMNASNNAAVVAETNTTVGGQVQTAQIVGNTAAYEAQQETTRGLAASQNSLLQSIFGMIIPSELAHGGIAQFTVPGGQFGVGVAPTTPPPAPAPIVVNHYMPTPLFGSGPYSSGGSDENNQGGVGGGGNANAGGGYN